MTCGVLATRDAVRFIEMTYANRFIHLLTASPFLYRRRSRREVQCFVGGHIALPGLCPQFRTNKKRTWESLLMTSPPCFAEAPRPITREYQDFTPFLLLLMLSEEFHAVHYVERLVTWYFGYCCVDELRTVCTILSEVPGPASRHAAAAVQELPA